MLRAREFDVSEFRVGRLKRHFPGYFFLRHLKNLWFPKELEYQILARIGSNYDILVDVGANLGMYTYLFARQSAKVYAFEPNPYLHEYLSASLDLSVSIRNAAVSGEDGEVVLFIPKNEVSSGRSSAVRENAASYTKQLIEHHVKCVRLDSAGIDVEGKKVFVKIDVEGFEAHVLAGCERWLRDNVAVDFMIEIDASHNSDWCGVFERLRSRDYGVYYYDGCTMRSYVPEQEQGLVLYRRTDGKKIDNFFFSKKGWGGASEAND